MKKGVVCQDFSDSYSDNKVKIVAISDGHGSPQYFRSDRGARFAVEAAIQCLREFADGFSKNGEDGKFPLAYLFDKQRQTQLITQLCKSILSKWYTSVEKDYDENPFNGADLNGLEDKYVNRYRSGNYVSAYGATLIAALITDSFWMAIQIGDGKFIFVDSECKCCQPVPWDEDCFGAVTTSICQNDALERFRYYISSEMPMALCLGSDGVDDTYGDGEILNTFYKQLILEFVDSGFDNAAMEIEALLPDITEKGSHDDISIGLVFDGNMIKNKHELLEKQIAIVKLKEEIDRLEDRIKRYERKLIIKKNTEDEMLLQHEIDELKSIVDLKYSQFNDISVM